MSGPMVRAILEGRKSVTRRVVKGLPTCSLRYDGIDENDPAIHWWEELDEHGEPTERYHEVRCPFRVGQRLWVRETWAEIPDEKPSGYFTDPKWTDRRAWYAADNDKPLWGGKWRPSIFMPRWASRILLETTAVRGELLQDINEENAEAEGVEPALLGYAGHSVDNMWDIMSYRASFEDLWNHIRGEGAWERNDPVWVLTFRRIDQLYQQQQEAYGPTTQHDPR